MNPLYATKEAAAADLSASDSIWIGPGDWAPVPTGVTGAEVFADMGTNVCGLICPRSGLARKHGITVFNSPGVIDADYRGEIEVLLINHSREEYIIKPGDRIAQLLLLKRDWNFSFGTVDTAREGGFGSTGD